MYDKPKKIENVENSMFKIRFKNIKYINTINNTYVEVTIFNDKNSLKLQILLDNFINVINNENINNNISQYKYFVVKNNYCYFLINEHLSIYEEVMKDLNKRMSIKKKTTKYKIGGIYKTLTTQHLYCGMVNCFIDNDMFIEPYHYDIEKYFKFKPLEKPIKKHLLIKLSNKEMELINNKQIKTLKEFFEYKNNLILDLGINDFTDKLYPKNEAFLLENDIEDNYLQEQLFGKIIDLCKSFYTIKNINPDFLFDHHYINFILLFISLNDKLENNKCLELLNLIKLYEKNCEYIYINGCSKPI